MKKLITVTALLMASVSANAGVVSAAGGVSWESAPGPYNFTPLIEFSQWWTSSNSVGAGDINGVLDTTALDPQAASLASATNPELVGIGSIVTDSGNTGQPSCGGCQLTFSFGGIFFDASGPSPIDASQAWLNIYLDYSSSTDMDVGLFASGSDTSAAASQVAKAVDGDLWLSLDVKEFFYLPITSDPTLRGFTEFYGDVTGGPAQVNIVPDAVESLTSSLFFDFGVDGLTTSFLAGSSIVKFSGLGSSRAFAQTVSEPGAIAFLSVGLIGIALTARRRMRK